MDTTAAQAVKNTTSRAMSLARLMTEGATKTVRERGVLEQIFWLLEVEVEVTQGIHDQFTTLHPKVLIICPIPGL